MIATNCGLGFLWKERMLWGEMVRESFISNVNFKLSFREWLKNSQRGKKTDEVEGRQLESKTAQCEVVWKGM